MAQFLLVNSDGLYDPPELNANMLLVDQIVVFPISPGKTRLNNAFSGKKEEYNEVSDLSEGVFHIGLAKGDSYYVYEISVSDICWDPENADRCAHRGESGPRITSIRGIHVDKIIIKSGNLIIEDTK